MQRRAGARGAMPGQEQKEKPAKWRVFYRIETAGLR
jgi:hypothetical protein